MLEEGNTIEIAHYILKKLLSHNKKIKIWRAVRKDEPHAHVILKILPHENLISFQHEYELLKQLKIKGIIRPYSLNVRGRFAILELEDIPGKLLQDFIKNRALNLEEFFPLALQLINIISKLHEANIIHKDINLSNFIIHPQTSELTLIDLRFATQLSTFNQGYINPHLLQETLAYISPEQTGRINRLIDYRSDFYSLGIVFYQMLTGELPFQEDDVLELVYSHIAKIPPLVSEKNSKIPIAVAAIVEKLLAKMPEERYKNILGLKNDLTKCEEYWKNTANIPQFKLGETDLPSHLNISHKLYGRMPSVKLLLESFDWISQGHKKLMLVTGYSGVGKTSLVAEVHKPILRQKGYYVAGKYDQVQRSTPYSGFLNALQGLIEQILAEPEDILNKLKNELAEKIEDLGPLIVEVLPAMELIIGKQASGPVRDSKEARNLFNLAMKKIIQTVASKAHPFVMFIDDLQWADVASLKLIEYLLKENDIQYFLIIGAYRDNEVDIGHPLLMIFQELQKIPHLVEKLSLQSLQLADIEQLLIDTFGCNEPQIKELALQMMKKTNGNPFFANEFLKVLYRNNLIYFSYKVGKWKWDIDKINQQAITDNVVDLLMANLQKLSLSVQETIKTAACIGHTFDLALLANLRGHKISVVGADLWETMRLELIVPLNENYQFLTSNINKNEERENIKLAQSIKYRFIHDRVQQAAYFLMTEQEKKQLNLKIGYTLLALKEAQGKEAVEEAFFEIINHIIVGKEYISSQEKKLEVAKLSCKAGHKAIESSAFYQAQRYFEEGLSLLGEDCWKTHHTLTFELHLATIRAYYLNKEFDHVIKLVRETLTKTNQPLEKGLLYKHIAQTYADQGKLLESLLAGIKTLMLLGIEFPIFENMIVNRNANKVILFFNKSLDKFFRGIYKHIIGKYLLILDRLPKLISKFILKFSFILLKILFLVNGITYKKVEKEVKTIHEELNHYTHEQLIDLPVMADPIKTETIKLLGRLVVTAYMAAPRLLPIFVCLMVRLTLKYGNSRDSAFGYACYALLLNIFMKDIDKSYNTALLSEALMHRISNKLLPNVIHTIFLTYVWKRNLTDLRGQLTESYSIALEQGSWDDACTCMYGYMTLGFYIGLNLREQESEMSKGRKIMLQNKQQAMYYWSEVFYQFVCNLLGLTSNSLELELTDFDNPSHKILLTPESTVNKSAICKGYILKSFLAYIFQNYEKVLTDADVAITFLESSLAMPLVTTLNLTHTLTLTALYPKANEATQKEYMKKILKYKAEVENWAAHAPMNYLANSLLINAEYAKILKKFDEADKYYHQAIKVAAESGFLHIICLTHECTARFYLDSHQLQQAKHYINEAYLSYKTWGAVAKCKVMEKEYSEWLKDHLEDIKVVSEKNKEIPSSLSISNAETNVDVLDFFSILKANQTIASEIELDQLIRKLLSIVLENTGAQRAFLLLYRGQKWVMEGAATFLNQQFILVGNENNDELDMEIPVKMINYVKRTRKSLIIEDISKHSGFLTENYNVDNPPKSILMMPIFYQNELRRILYLENTLTVAAFKPLQLQTLDLLIGQASIALENAYLIVEYKRAKDEAEAGNRIKSEFLANISHELRTPVNAIVGYTEIVQEDLQNLEDTESQIESLQKVLGSSKHLLNLIDELLDITKIEMGKMDILAEEVEVKDFMEKIKNIAFPLMKKNHNEMEFIISSQLTRMKVDPLKLRQILLNLLSNAVKFTENGKITLTVNPLPPTSDCSEERIEFQVSDTGIGMDEKEFDKLFKIFSQIDGSSTRKYGGTGLGLYLTRKLIEMMSGQISVKSKKGEGSTFTVILPLRIN